MLNSYFISTKVTLMLYTYDTSNPRAILRTPSHTGGCSTLPYAGDYMGQAHTHSLLTHIASITYCLPIMII